MCSCLGKKCALIKVRGRLWLSVRGHPASNSCVGFTPRANPPHTAAEEHVGQFGNVFLLYT